MLTLCRLNNQGKPEQGAQYRRNRNECGNILPVELTVCRRSCADSGETVSAPAAAPLQVQFLLLP